MEIIPQVVAAIQEVLGESADRLAKATKFVKREVKVTGSNYSQTLVFGWLSNPDATLEELTQTGAAVGLEITPQGLDQRFTQEACAFMKGVFDNAVEQVVSAEPVAIPLLERFNGVYLKDSTIVTLPDSLKEMWPGCGGVGDASGAAVKIEVGLDMLCGTLLGPLLEAGKVSDRGSELHRMALPAGSLRITDLGYWSLEQLEVLSTSDVFWLIRAQSQTAVFDTAGKRWSLAALTKAQVADEIDMSVTLGVQKHLAARLVGRRVPQKVSEERRRKLREAAQREGKTPTQDSLALCDWVLFVTNVPTTLLTLSEVLVLARLRWQIELLFKLWKDHGHLDESNSAQPYRILCECYAKLVAMVIQHWLLLTCTWRFADRSLRKAAPTVRNHALSLALALPDADALTSAIYILSRCLAHGCRINKSRKTPRTFQMLLATESMYP